MMKSKIKPIGAGWAILVLLPFLFACQSAYYKTMEKLGYHKRDLMADRVQEARDAQEEAKEQFESAMDQFRSVVNIISALEKE